MSETINIPRVDWNKFRKIIEANEMSSVTSDLVNEKVACEILDIGRNTLGRYIREGKVNVVSKNTHTRQKFFSRAALMGLKLIVLILLSINLNAQIYGGAYLGYSASHAKLFNYNSGKIETFKSQYLFFSMVGGYSYKSWLIESAGTYNGGIYTDLIAGRSFLLADNISFDVLAGESANLAFKKGYNVVQKFSPQVTGRLNLGDFSITGIYTDRTYMLGIGVKCLTK